MNAKEIGERREKVSFYLVKCTPQKTIAELLGISRNTVVRDVTYLKKTSQNWLDDLARDGFIYEYRLGLEKIRDHERELQKLFLEAENVAQKIKILEALDANAKLYLDLLGETPTVHAYKRALNLDDKEDARCNTGRNKKGDMERQ